MGDHTTPCPIVPVQNRVDTTGAGDFYATGSFMV